ncbi:hypothetical protein COO60DRAFT_1515372 [Scenedesmus sp. NREL 46B-D3]|nr:hypothetical protein COO60DRAFT_1515372 [Scenedesmus sp. NREL 46B-D3]
MYTKIASAAAAGLAPQPNSALLAAASAAKRLLHRSTAVMGHGSHVSGNNPDVIEREKQRNLQGKTPDVIPGEPGFNPALASESEAAVRAERAPSLDIEQLQEHSVKILQHLHDDADHPGSGQGHDPSDSPAIQENLKYSKEKDAPQNPSQ